MSEMLQLRAWLLDSQPEVWRRLIVDPRLTLDRLHDVLQIAFGWTNSHLHQFHEQNGTRYGRRTEFDPDVIDERKVLIADVLDRPKKKIAYEYDFGDSWIHAVQLEKRVDHEAVECPTNTRDKSGRSKPRAATCVAGERNGPPEDCGGLSAYLDLLELKRARKKKYSDEERETLEWLGDWDPDRCDLVEINRQLGRVRTKKMASGEGTASTE